MMAYGVRALGNRWSDGNLRIDRGRGAPAGRSPRRVAGHPAAAALGSYRRLGAGHVVDRVIDLVHEWPQRRSRCFPVLPAARGQSLGADTRTAQRLRTRADGGGSGLHATASSTVTATP